MDKGGDFAIEIPIEINALACDEQSMLSATTGLHGTQCDNNLQINHYYSVENSRSSNVSNKLNNRNIIWSSKFPNSSIFHFFYLNFSKKKTLY